MGKIIGSVIAILLFAVVAVTFIIIRSTTKAFKSYKEHKNLIAEQIDDVVCLDKILLDIPVSYYMRKYTYKVKFKSLNFHKVYELYVEEFDALDLIVNDEYQIVHESLVLFKIKKNYQRSIIK